MAADISADTGPGASGWARGSHTCSGTAPALEPNPTTARTNASRAHPGSQVRAAGSDEGERLASGMGGQQHQAEQQRDRPELGHHPVPLAGPLHLGALPVIGQDEEQRGHRHQLPEEEERADARGGRHEQQGGDEQREDARRRAAGQAVAAVAEAKHHGAQPPRRRRRPRRARRADRGEARIRERVRGVDVHGASGTAAGEHATASGEPHAHAAIVRVSRHDDPCPGRRAAGPDHRGGQPEQGRGDQEPRRSPPRQAPQRGDDGLGLGRAAGDLDVDRDDVGDRPDHPVGAAEHTAIAGAVPHRHHHRGSGTASSVLRSGPAMLWVTGPVTSSAVGMAGRRLEADAEPLGVVDGREARGDLELAAVARPGVDMTELEGAPVAPCRLQDDGASSVGRSRRAGRWRSRRAICRNFCVLTMASARGGIVGEALLERHQLGTQQGTGGGPRIARSAP